MADENLRMALHYFPRALIYPPHSLEPENADRRLDPGTARLVRRLREDYPSHVIVIAG